MNTFASLLFLIAIAAIAISSVAYSNYMIKRRKQINRRIEELKYNAEKLTDVVLMLDQVCETREIPRLVNDEVVEVYEAMVKLDPKSKHLKASLDNAEARSKELNQDLGGRQISRFCKSDAQLARYTAYLKEAAIAIRERRAKGHLNHEQLNTYILYIEWLQLQIKVISTIIQGHKAFVKQGALTADAFYQKAIESLTRSAHPDPRRQLMIEQLNDIVYRRRKSLDKELMPETDFNPENFETDDERMPTKPPIPPAAPNASQGASA